MAISVLLFSYLCMLFHDAKMFGGFCVSLLTWRWGWERGGDILIRMLPGSVQCVLLNASGPAHSTHIQSHTRRHTDKHIQTNTALYREGHLPLVPGNMSFSTIIEHWGKPIIFNFVQIGADLTDPTPLRGKNETKLTYPFVFNCFQTSGLPLVQLSIGKARVNMKRVFSQHSGLATGLPVVSCG